MSSCADGKELFIEVHETCITDFLKDFNGCIKIMGKEGDLYIIQVFIMTKHEYPKSKENKQ